MDAYNKDILKKMLEFTGNDYYSKFLEIEFLEADENHCKARFPFKNEIKNPYGTTHGGVLYSVSDIVAGTMCCMGGYFCTTVNGNLNYLLPAVSKDYLYVEAKVMRRGAHLICTGIEIYDDNDSLVDTGSFTFFITDKKIFED